MTYDQLLRMAAVVLFLTFLACLTVWLSGEPLWSTP